MGLQVCDIKPSTQKQCLVFFLYLLSEKNLQMYLDKENQGRDRVGGCQFKATMQPGQGHRVRPYLKHETTPALSPHYFTLCQTLPWCH